MAAYYALATHRAQDVLGKVPDGASSQHYLVLPEPFLRTNSTPHKIHLRLTCDRSETIIGRSCGGNSVTVCS